jgi:hypothetical protein
LRVYRGKEVHPLEARARAYSARAGACAQAIAIVNRMELASIPILKSSVLGKNSLKRGMRPARKRLLDQNEGRFVTFYARPRRSVTPNLVGTCAAAKFIIFNILD